MTDARDGRRATRPRGRLPLLVARFLAGSLVAASSGQVRAAAAGRPERLAPQLVVGARVEVKGRFLADGAFLAEEIELKQEDDRDEELRGLIESVDAENRRLRILGFTVRFEADAEVSREPGQPARFEDLKPGLRVKVDGARSPDGAFIAEKIRIRQNQYAERKIVGAIEAIEPAEAGAAVLRLLGLAVLVTEGTDLERGTGPVRPAVTRRAGAADEEDVLVTGRNRLGRYLSYFGEIRLQAEVLSNPDLDEMEPDGDIVPEISGVIGLLGEAGPVVGYLEATGDREYFVRGGEGLESLEDRGDVRLSSAYIEVEQFPAPGLSLAVGRQKFYDERRWFYDVKNLDAVRLFGSYGAVVFQASVSRDLFDESRNVRDQEKLNLMAEVRWDLTRELALQAFYIDRRDRNELDDSPRVVGLRAAGDAGRRVEFWADLAGQDGTRSRRDPATGALLPDDIRAYALDVGGTFRPRSALDPSFTAALALGSGDRPGGEDEAFRQTGFQRNRDSLNGVVSFRYYGEVLDPELTNLRILRLGAGLRPLRPLSVDLVYHRYRQDVASSRLTNAELSADPSGIDPHLGEELDLIVGYEPSKRMELRFTAGYFDPGAAFDGAPSPATIVTFRSKFRF